GESVDPNFLSRVKHRAPVAASLNDHRLYAPVQEQSCRRADLRTPRNRQRLRLIGEQQPDVFETWLQYCHPLASRIVTGIERGGPSRSHRTLERLRPGPP